MNYVVLLKDLNSMYVLLSYIYVHEYRYTSINRIPLTNWGLFLSNILTI